MTDLIEWHCSYCNRCNYDETGQPMVYCGSCECPHDDDWILDNGMVAMKNVPQTAEQKRGYIAGLRARYPDMFDTPSVAINITGDETEFIYFNGYNFSCDENGNMKVEPIGDA